MASLSVMDSAFCHTTAGQDLASHTTVLVKDSSKRKRVNRKLKQCKFDARREQWLSQVTTIKHCKDKESSPPGKIDLGEVIHPENHDNIVFASRDIHRYSSEKYDKALSHSHLRLIPAERYDDEDLKDDCSPSSFGSCISSCFEAEVSPKSVGSDTPKSKVKRLGTDYGRGSREQSINEIKSKDGTAGHNRCMTDAYDVSAKIDEYGLDSEIEDWEAVADALGVSVTHEDNCNTSAKEEGVEEKVRLSLAQASLSECNTQMKGASCEVISRSSSSRAWRPDDVHRPATLPNLSKQQSLPAHFPDQEQQSVCTRKVLEDLLSGPLLCPICAEELDMTDSSFEPCACGFQLCLFCHHRIASEDGRCPGCRRFYSSSPSAKVAPSLVSC